MTTNVSIEYANALAKYEAAKTNAEKLAALLEMKSQAPSHKGAENMKNEITKKIVKLKAEIDKEKAQASKKGGGPSIAVKKDGVGQIVLVGFPSSGKTTLFNAMTGLTNPTGEWGYITSKPEIGMMDFKGAKIQLVDLPPIVEGSAEGKVNGREILAVVRNADAIVLVLDAAHAMEQYKVLTNELTQSGILLNRKKPNIRITASDFPGFSITGKEFLKIPQEELVNHLKAKGMHNVQVILNEPTTLETVDESMDETLVYKRTLMVVMKSTKPAELKREKGLIVLTWDGGSPEQKKQTLDLMFEIMDKVYVYTKKPGQPPATHMPLVVPKGSTVLDVAALVHKDIVQNLKQAKVWGSTKTEGQRVAKDYVVQDGDIVEFGW